jgi:hypothetical protein
MKKKLDEKERLNLKDVINGEYMVSTVELAFEDSLRYSYETMVFRVRNGKTMYTDAVDSTGYYSQDEAIAGHNEMVKKWSNIN